MRTQTVHTVEDYHDGPIEGFAEFEDAPHHFKCQFDDSADEYSSVYCLTPISADTLRLAIERHQIFDRWNTAFRTGQTSIDTHPALPNERARYDELNETISQSLKDSKAAAFRAHAKFLPDGRVGWDKLPTRA